MNSQDKIADTEEAWDDGTLGRDEAFVAVAPEDDEVQINEALGLQPISIRLEKSLIEDFKMIAEINGMGYQPLMRQALRRFAECEMKRLVRGMAADRKRKAAKDKAEQKPAPKARTKKAA